MANRRKGKKIDARTFSFLMMAFPSILIVAIGSLYPQGWGIAAAIAVYQLIYMKRFVDSYYKKNKEF
jgi:hypothetical protein